MYLLGYDLGSSSIKIALTLAGTGENIRVIQFPELEMEIKAPQAGWAEQDPEMWWKNLCLGTKKLLKETGVNPNDIQSVGIAYQMHGLVLVDKHHKVLTPSIIWCDSRAVEIGKMAFSGIGQAKCLKHLLNSPGNFTASKLRWVKENEPEIFEKVDKFLLPGDFIALKLTGEASSTISGLSEGIFWDFIDKIPAQFLFDHYGIPIEMIPEIRPTFSEQGKLTKTASEETALPKGIPVTYRAGDQPNNALSLNVLKPGEIAATGGTSGVIYGLTDRPLFDHLSRVNGFAHVNYSLDNPIIGILLCINGAGSQYNFIRQLIGEKGISYQEMERQAADVPVGSDGLCILPFGNGAERMLENKDPGSRICNIQFNRHKKETFYRATLEGIAFSFVYGAGIMREMGLDVSLLRAGNDNLFQSSIFSQTISNLLNCKIEMLESTGAIGAANASGVGIGAFNSPEEAMNSSSVIKIYEPEKEVSEYLKAQSKWTEMLSQML